MRGTGVCAPGAPVECAPVRYICGGQPRRPGFGVEIDSGPARVWARFFLIWVLLQVAEQLKNTPENPEKTSKNRFPLYFVWDKKPTKKPKNFRPGPELKTVFIALEMKFAMIFFSARARTENSIYSFGNEVRDDRVTFPKLYIANFISKVINTVSSSGPGRKKKESSCSGCFQPSGV